MQRAALAALGVAAVSWWVDHDLTGTYAKRSPLVHRDIRVVTMLARFARSLPDDRLTARIA